MTVPIIGTRASVQSKDTAKLPRGQGRVDIRPARANGPGQNDLMPAHSSLFIEAVSSRHTAVPSRVAKAAPPVSLVR